MIHSGLGILNRQRLGMTSRVDAQAAQIVVSIHEGEGRRFRWRTASPTYWPYLVSPKSAALHPVFRTLATIALVVCALFVAVNFLERERDPSERTPNVTGTIRYVIDGDSAVVARQGGPELTIRLEGIDAPENGQSYGSDSRRWLQEATENRSVRVVAAGTDRYGRMLANLYVGERWLNLESVAAGMSWHYVQYKQDSALAKAQIRARVAKLGLWHDAEPLAPWDFRSQQRMEKTPANVQERR